MKYFSLLFIGLLVIGSQVLAGEMNGGGGVLVSVPMGHFADVSKTGVGLGGKILYQFDNTPWLNIRTDLGYLSYESTQKPVIAGGYVYSQTTRSEGFHIAVGPQVTYGEGAIRAYAAATAGLYLYQTVISYPELAYYYGYVATETRDSNTCLGGTVGGGIMFDIGLGPLIDIGVRYGYIKNGAVEKIEDRKIKSNAQELTISIGVIFFTSGRL